ncbi:MAG TPA: PRC-barrel domain-containing protein [Azospirillum sp.]|nr:PRC-barrel domain-containing protein [Azospirillum sp.]
MKTSMLAATAALALIAAAPASAQDKSGSAQQAQKSGKIAGAPVVAASSWDREQVRGGYSAEALIDTSVYGKNGEEIGEVANIIVGPNGQIRSLIVEVGGFLDIGDTHFAVPWKQAQIGANLERITVPITETNYRDYGLFGEYGYDYRVSPGQNAGGSNVRRVDEDADARGRAWKVSELLDDTVRLSDVRGYGYVEDLIFNKDGKLQAVVVQPDVTYGIRGAQVYPYYGYGYGFDPGLDYYELPYGRNDVAGLPPFDYRQFDIVADVRADRGAGTSGGSK